MEGADYKKFFGPQIRESYFMLRNQVLRRNLNALEGKTDIYKIPKELNQDFDFFLAKLDVANEFVYDYELILKEIAVQKYSK